jgi:hypothetical protein
LLKLVAELATETRRGFDRVAEQFAEADQRIRENEARYAERSRQTDERIDKLASATGEFMRRN